MQMDVNIRAVVLDILTEIEKEGEFSHITINNALLKYQYLDRTQRAFINRLSLGTIECRIEMDYILNQYSKTPVNRMKPLIRRIMRMAVYQIIYMENVPDSAACNEAVKLAAKRGIDIRIVTPAIPDKKMIFRMTQSSYKELLRAGVKIYQYTPGFIHSKCILTDDNLTSIGSINMDNRSFYHHFECGVLVYDSSIIAEVKYDMLSTMKESEEITLDWCKEHMSRITLVDAFLRLLSPLL